MTTPLTTETVPISHQVVGRCFLDYAFGLQFFDEQAETTVRIEGPFTLEQGDKLTYLWPENPETLGPAFALVFRMLHSMTVNENRALSLVFEEGVVLTVEPDPDCDAWSITGPQLLLHCRTD